MRKSIRFNIFSATKRREKINLSYKPTQITKPQKPIRTNTALKQGYEEKPEKRSRRGNGNQTTRERDCLPPLNTWFTSLPSSSASCWRLGKVTPMSAGKLP
ncbi:hypothetical protein Q3G72_030711 [Acer saccharum]|nr:hypothetical protein Q3G72_030711 [Acer saccharum]